MKVDFKTLPHNSRLWVYQSNRDLIENEIKIINDQLSTFIDSWQAHGKDLKASFEIKYNRFVVIAVDEISQNATGCSIDDSVRILRKIENQIGVDFFDRMSILFKDGDLIKSASMKEFKELLS